MLISLSLHMMIDLNIEIYGHLLSHKYIQKDYFILEQNKKNYLILHIIPLFLVTNDTYAYLKNKNH